MLHRPPGAICLGAALIAITGGCGGGGVHLGSPGGPIDGGGGGSAIPNGVTALFHVDVPTGKVTIVRPGESANASKLGTMRPNAVFSGSAVTFNTNVLLDQPGNVGVKTLDVSITNNWALPIGQDTNENATGLSVVFGNFTNIGSYPDVRNLTNVAAFAGSGAAGATNGPLSSATFSGPTGVAYAGNGNLYVTDKTNNLIRKISGGQVSTLAGSATAGSTNGQGSAASFSGPFGIAVNPVDGALIVTDLAGDRVRRVTQTGSVTTIAGTGTASEVDGAGNAATFNGPSGVAVDAAGTIYVADFVGNKVRRIVLSGGADPTKPASYQVSTLAGSGAVGAVNGVGAGASFSSPCGVTLGPGNVLYVADQGNNSVRSITPGGEVATIAGAGAATSVDGPGNSATFHSLRGVTYANGAIIVADRLGNRIRQIVLTPGGSPSDPASWFVSTVAGSGSSGGNNGPGDVATFNQPQLMAADQGGNLYVADLTNNKIRKVIPDNGVFPVGIPTAPGTAELVQLSNPDTIFPSTGDGINMPVIGYPEAVASGGTSHTRQWWFAVPKNVSAFEFTVTVEARTGGLAPPNVGVGAGSPDSIVRTVAGTINSNGFNDGNGAAARMGLMKYGSMDRAGNLYVTDLTNEAIRRITPQGQVTTICGGPGNLGASQDGTGANAKISSINGVAVQPDGLAVFFGDGNLVRVATIFSFSDPTNAGNWIVTTLGGTPGAGNTDGVLTGASFDSIEDMALDSGGNLFLTEFFGNRIRKLTFKGGSVADGSAWQVSTFAGDNSAINGASGSTDGTGTVARLFNPRGIAVARNGDVYFADQSNFKIRKISPNQVVTTIAGSGTQGYADGTGATAKFSLPYGVDVDSSGYVYVGDIGTFTVRRVSPSGVVSTVAGISGSLGTVDGPGNIATFVRPAGVSVSPSGDLFVCDQSGVRLIQRLINSGTR
ncbi:MAG TPA: hypothetical protein VG944_15955 [Fimbriimonas sp.]|nr:hypothetical protein [Fimbriimonas sp.]